MPKTERPGRSHHCLGTDPAGLGPVAGAAAPGLSLSRFQVEPSDRRWHAGGGSPAGGGRLWAGEVRAAQLARAQARTRLPGPEAVAGCVYHHSET